MIIPRGTQNRLHRESTARVIAKENDKLKGYPTVRVDYRHGEGRVFGRVTHVLLSHSALSTHQYSVSLCTQYSVLTIS